MSDTRVIIPLDREGRAAMAEYGLGVRGLRGRAPTRDDVMFALGQVPWLTQKIEETPKRLSITLDYQVAATPFDPAIAQWAALDWTQPTPEAPDGRLAFEAGDTEIMADVLFALSHRCGAFALISAAGDLPLIIRPMRPLQRFRGFGDGSTKPDVGNRVPTIVLQDRAVFTIGLWERGDFGGGTRWPINDADLIAEATTRIKAEAPHLLRAVRCAHHICWPDMVARMRFHQ